MTPQEIYRLVAPELERVEEALKAHAQSPVRPISEIGGYLLSAGGKRIRPVLLLLTARMIGQPLESAVRLASVVEFIHNATLVHDDIIDDADTRRGRPSANSQWGNPMTVLAGDWLYMQSFAVALQEKNLDVLAQLIQITQKMVEGELLQLTYLGRPELTQEQLLDVVERKTAYLFAGCMRLPAIAAGLDGDVAARLGRIGMGMGMAFQLVDDLLDLTATREALGKPVASDLKEGKLTLPVHFVMQEGNPADVEKIRTVVREREFRSVDRAEILRLVEKFDGLSRTQRLAEQYAGEARQLLGEFPPTVYRDAILRIPEFILNRTA